jgi:uncharacterized protein (DUF488 family)
VRIHPGSRRLPHFNQVELDESLAAESIRYEHFKALGVRRDPRADTPNTGWETPAFRGYADHMETPEFAAGVERLIDLAAEKMTTVMCAEALWWRCHRRIIADYLLAAGEPVAHIMADGKMVEARLTPAAQRAGAVLIYPRSA